MSTNRRKRRGGDVNSGQASKRSRLLPSSAGGPSTAESRDLEESAVDEIIDLTNESSQSEVIDLTGDDSVVQRDQNEEHPHVASSADDLVVLLVTDDEEEPRDDDGTWPAGAVSSPIWIEDDSQPLEGYGQESRNLTPRSQQLLDSPVPSSDDEDETSDDVTDTESEDWESSGEETTASGEWQPAVRCPICMDFYSQIVQRERHIVSTQCGHLFCSQCLPVALETARACPTCRTELYPNAYHRIFF